MQLFLNETDYESSHLTFAIDLRKELLHVKGRITLLPKIIKTKKTLSVIKKMFALKFSIFLLSFAALTEAQEIFFLDHKCSNTTTFVRNSPYEANLNILLSSLASNATRNDINGFYNASTGHGVYEVYGLFLCRGDVSVEVCLKCVNLARNGVVQRCPIQKEAIIWYDQCFLRYSNSNIFSSLSQTPSVYMSNTQKITVDVEFNKLLVNTISDAVNVAASAPSGEKKLATKKEIYKLRESLYVLVQCTPDLSKNDCNQCLLLSKLSISICCNNNRGGRVLFPSCNFRYENYSFYNQAAVVAMSPPPPLSTPVVLLPPSPGPIGDGSKSMWIKVGAGLSAVIAVLFFSACTYTMRRRTNPRTEEIENIQEEQLLDLVGRATVGDDYSDKYIQGEVTSQDLPLIRLDVINEATKQFSDENKLGQGGFGPVYRAWKLWSDGQGLELMDPMLDHSNVATEVLRCIHIGLLCVQEDPADRPTMSSVLHMLASDTITLPIPKQPAFFIGRFLAMESQSSNQKVCSANELTLTVLSDK
ncbi:hypothetical protein NC651_026289 [Populus alba x Populus x berolinensis]|nr:hypothetical protein NC651_026289 [Populus alba x Populus x berolinensis]